MNSFLKIDGIWESTGAIFVKENGIWTRYSKADFETYAYGRSFTYGGHMDSHTLFIIGPSSVTGESCTFHAIYDGVEDVTSATTWTVTAGAGMYAVINPQTGEMTILGTFSPQDRPVTIEAAYMGAIAEKTVLVTYQEGKSEHTEVQITTDEVGNVSTTTAITVNNPDGSSHSTSSTTTTDAAGIAIGSNESEVTVNSDGSYVGSSTNYDENGNPTDKVGESGDTQGNVNTQNVVYDESGNSAVTSYVIDTSNNPDGTKNYNADGVNTEYYAFDITHGFVVDFHFTIDFSNQPAGQDENHHNILTAKRASPSPWYGFQLRHSSTNKVIILGTQFSSGSNTNTNIQPMSLTGNVAEYNIKIIYDPEDTTAKFKAINADTGAIIFSKNDTFPDIPELEYIKVTLGYAMDANGDPYRYSNINVKNFSIKKLTKVAKPEISCDGEHVTITCETAGADIYYRLNEVGVYTLYSSPIEISADTVVQAYAVLGEEESDTVTETCIYDNGIEEPEIYCDGVNVEITCVTTGVTIFYRLNETGGYVEYVSAFTITADTVVETYAELNGKVSETVKETCIYNPEHDYSRDYLTFRIIFGGTIGWAAAGTGYTKTIQYSLNGGTWTSITAAADEDAPTITVSDGDVLRFKGTNNTYAGSNTNYDGFSGGSAYYNVEGNIMSLVYGDDFIGQTALTGSYNFCSLFKESNVVSAENLILPATTLTPHCYRALFANNPTFEVAPELPATNLAISCYRYMFQDCALVTAPDLLATTLVNGCYEGMFNNCLDLTYIKCLATNIHDVSAATASWTMYINTNGTFVKDANTEWERGGSAIPTRWVVVDYGLKKPTVSCDGLQITLVCETAGASIYYRLNEAGEYALYSTPIPITADTVVEAYSVLDEETSPIVKETCIYDDGIEEPVIYCDGEFVSITCDTGGATIYYRVDQTGSYTQYDTAIEISADTIFEAYAEIDGRQSDVVSANCIYDASLKAPVIECDGTSVIITCRTAGADIYYRVNQEGSFNQYVCAVTITADTIFEAYSTYSGQTSSTVAEMCVYDPTHDYSKDYLTFKVLTNGTINWKSIGTGMSKTIQYSINDGPWYSITAGSSTPVSVTAGDAVRFRGSNTEYAKDKSNYSGFEGGTATYDVEGNIMSLVYGDNFSGQTALPGKYTFCSLFKLSNAISAKNLILPAETLTEGCYRAMFSKATSLLEAPAIIPATTLAKDCCWYMFEECPIDASPELPAPVLVSTCYGWMFVKCYNLIHITCLAVSGFSATNCLQSWVSGVAATGTFIKDENAVTGSTGWKVDNAAGIPSGWTIINSGDEIVKEPVIYCDGEEVSITCPTPNVTIYYQLDQTGGYLQYIDPIPITADTIVEAYAEKGEIQSSAVSATCEYYVEPPYSASNKDLTAWKYNGLPVDTPYSVNRIDGHSSSYAKGTFNFETTVSLKKAQPTYLWFQHADQSASIYVDNTLVEKHWGGYAAFFVDISNNVHKGMNNIKVALKNNEGSALAPAAGDFNFNATLGNVKLFTSPYLPAMNYGYDGFHVTSDVATSSATINIATNIPTGAVVTCEIDDGTYHYGASADSTGNEMIFSATVVNPHLWNGTPDPHLYNITLEIYHDGELYHRYVRPYGLRFYEYVIDQTVNGSAYTGFLLNGQPYFLRGCCMHDDIKDKANALNDADYAQTFSIVQELGCNFLRLAHYPHPKETYDWCDRLGIIVQTEGPCVNKMQSTMPTDYYDHLNTQYDDMVNQHYNHPCIMFWGLSNETTTDDKTFANEKINGYISRIKALDAERLVGYVMAQGAPDPSAYYNNPDADWFGCNIYEGWYSNPNSNDPSSAVNTRIKNIITNKSKALAYSEYGCGGTQHCHSDDFMTTTTRGNHERHDIEYMMWLHEGHIAAIKNYPQLLFTAQWQLFDIAVANRNEGYTVCLDGVNTSTNDELRRLNNKGLVERDHVTKKDPFYLYKAWWNTTDKFVHICGKDYTKTTDRAIKCYTNDGTSLSMYVNDTFVETVSVTDNIAVFTATSFNSGDIVRVDGANSSDTFTF